MFQLLHCLS